ncbi:MAG: hypothetical protein ACRD96_15240 [Bryobacteraceae bacterium]
MPFDPNQYGPEVARLLAFDGSGERLMPLAGGRCCSEPALRELKSLGTGLFPDARAPEAALAGLYLYFSCASEAHEIAQDIKTPDGSFWHAILHRQEPDAANAAYWFRRAGSHPVFPALAEAARGKAGLDAPWDPFRFIDVCEQARQKPGSDLERTALEIQRAEWQLLFDHCARGRR